MYSNITRYIPVNPNKNTQITSVIIQINHESIYFIDNRYTPITLRTVTVMSNNRFADNLSFGITCLVTK